MERIEVRRGVENGPDVRVSADIGLGEVALTITIDRRRSEHVIPRGRLAPIIARLQDAVVPAVAVDPTPAIATGYEVAITTVMSQSVFRWVSTTPAGWEPLADAALDLLRLAEEFP